MQKIEQLLTIFSKFWNFKFFFRCHQKGLWMAQNFHKNDFCPASSIWSAGIFLDFSPFFGQKTLKIHISVRGVGGGQIFFGQLMVVHIPLKWAMNQQIWKTPFPPLIDTYGDLSVNTFKGRSERVSTLFPYFAVKSDTRVLRDASLLRPLFSVKSCIT